MVVRGFEWRSAVNREGASVSGVRHTFRPGQCFRVKDSEGTGGW